jgi:hypothetical protein
MGIPICARLAELMGGSIALEDRADGPGARFTLTLPLDEVAAPRGPGPAGTVTPPPPDAATMLTTTAASIISAGVRDPPWASATQPAQIVYKAAGAAGAGPGCGEGT